MKSTFFSILILFLSVCLVFAQEIEVKQQDRHTYTFSTAEVIRIKNFEFVSAITTDKPDVYVINVRALTADNQTDEGIVGKLLFEINGKQEVVDFRKGLGSVTVTIKGTDKITMRDVDSDITRVGTISHPVSWGKIAGLALAVAVLAAVILWRRKKKKA